VATERTPLSVLAFDQFFNQELRERREALSAFSVIRGEYDRLINVSFGDS
jgi:hypothetical protein